MQLHHWVDRSVSCQNIWSKNNQVTGDSPTGLPHHQFWGATMMKGTESSLIEPGDYPETDPEISLYLDTKLCAKWLDRKLQTDFGFEWVKFQYMGLNSQTQLSQRRIRYRQRFFEARACSSSSSRIFDFMNTMTVLSSAIVNLMLHDNH